MCTVCRKQRAQKLCKRCPAPAKFCLMCWANTHAQLDHGQPKTLCVDCFCEPAAVECENCCGKICKKCIATHMIACEGSSDDDGCVPTALIGHRIWPRKQSWKTPAGVQVKTKEALTVQGSRRYHLSVSVATILLSINRKASPYARRKSLIVQSLAFIAHGMRMCLNAFCGAHRRARIHALNGLLIMGTWHTLPTASLRGSNSVASN